MSSTDWITIGGDHLNAAINPQGAELSSLADAQGREFLWQGDPAVWTGRAPILFPIVGELADGAMRLDGRRIAMGRHGFARRSHFEVVEAGADHALLRLAASEVTREAYPFDFVLDLSFTVDGATLSIVAGVANPGGRDLPFSLGFHPGFAWPLPGCTDKSAHRVTFAAPEPEAIRRLDADGLLLPERFATPVKGDTLTPDAALFADDAMIWDRLASRSLRFGVPGQSEVTLSFPDLPMLGIWQKPGAGYLCLEPWHGIADPVGCDADFTAKPGIILLPPGEQRAFHMDVTLPAL